MASLNIVEYSHIRESEGTLAQLPQEPALAIQNLTFTTEEKSSAFNALTRIVRLVSTVDCFVLFGNDPTVTDTTGIKLLAGQPEYFGLPDGVNVRKGSEDVPFKVSAVAA